MELPASAQLLLDRFRCQATALALLVLVAYTNSLESSFHFDDFAIFTTPQVVSPGFGWSLFRLAITRPLTYLTFHWNYLAGGQNPGAYHFVNLLLHAANSVLLLAIARRYLTPIAAFSVAAIFALHPLQTESVTYVFSRSTLLSTHLALWVLWFHGRGRYLAATVLFALSLLAKEETIALPAFLLLLDLMEPRRPNIPYFAALAALAALAAARLFYAIRVTPIDPVAVAVPGISPFHYLLTQTRVLWIYLRLAIAPIGLNLDHDVALSTSLLSPWTTLPATLALILLAAALIWMAWKKRSKGALWALGFFVLISPGSSVVVQKDLMFEHRTYLPLIALAIALGFLLERLPRGALTVAMLVLLPAMAIATIARNVVWHDEKSLWTDAASKSPNKGRPWLGLANIYWNDPAKAQPYLLKGLAVDPANGQLHTGYGIVLLSLDRPDEALAQFQRAIALSRESADRWNNIGAAYFKLNDLDRSLRSFNRALQFDPCNYNARRNLMMLYANRNQRQAAWEAGALPSSCLMLPAQTSELQALRRRVGKP
jgi:tetratricopeptide (TPR) repeat protein